MDFFTTIFHLITLKSDAFKTEVSNAGDLTAEKFNTIIEEFVPNHFYECIIKIEIEAERFFKQFDDVFEDTKKKMFPFGYETGNIVSRRFFDVWMKYHTAYYNSVGGMQNVHKAKCDIVFAEVISSFFNEMPKTVFINETEWKNARETVRRKLQECNIAYENANCEFIDSIEPQNVAYQAWCNKYQIWYERFQHYEVRRNNNNW